MCYQIKGQYIYHCCVFRSDINHVTLMLGNKTTFLIVIVKGKNQCSVTQFWINLLLIPAFFYPFYYSPIPKGSVCKTYIGFSTIDQSAHELLNTWYWAMVRISKSSHRKIKIKQYLSNERVKDRLYSDGMRTLPHQNVLYFIINTR